MVYRGHVKNGAVVLDQPAALPEGAEVEVTVTTAHSDDSVPTLYEQFQGFIGQAQGLPSDASINHDHYLYGAPKRS